MSNLIDAHLAHCRAAGFSRKTVQDRGDVLRRIHAELPFGLYDEMDRGGATTEELADWLAGPPEPVTADDPQPWSVQTKATYYTHVTGFYRWACSDAAADPLDYDPSAGLCRPRPPRCVPKPVTDAQLRRILDESAEPYRTWALLAALAGERAAEIAGQQREDITEDDITIINGKGGKDRVVPTHPDVWRSVRDLPPGPIARRPDGTQANADQVADGARLHFRRRLDMPHTGLHRLRHWFGTTTLRITKNLRVVQELMGHESPATTAGYTLVTSEERRAAIQALPTLAAGS